MSDKAIWRTAAWMSAGILTVTYLLLVPIDIPQGDSAFRFGFKIGFGLVIVACTFVPSWLTRVVENRLKAMLTHRTPDQARTVSALPSGETAPV
jgi:hypothetical protein